MASMKTARYTRAVRRYRGTVEINVDRAKAYGFCPGGSEKLRFTWSFIDGDISRVMPGSISAPGWRLVRCCATSPVRRVI